MQRPGLYAGAFKFFIFKIAKKDSKQIASRLGKAIRKTSRSTTRLRSTFSLIHCIYFHRICAPCKNSGRWERTCAVFRPSKLNLLLQLNNRGAEVAETTYWNWFFDLITRITLTNFKIINADFLVPELAEGNTANLSLDATSSHAKRAAWKGGGAFLSPSTGSGTRLVQCVLKIYSAKISFKYSTGSGTRSLRAFVS